MKSLEDFDILTVHGLSKEEVVLRLRQEGFNELPSSKPRNVFTIAFEVVREPMFLLLVACGVLYLFLGDHQEAMMLLGFVVVIMGITFYQERKTERALEALRDLSSPRALVIRDGKQERIAGRDVVRGDVIVLSEGDRVPADARLIHSINLSIDESLLTGESVPVRKSVASEESGTEQSRPGGDDQPFVYSGSLVVGGQGLAEVTAIGSSTELGKIGKSLQSLESQETPLQRETSRLVRKLAIFGACLCVVVVLLYGATKYKDGMHDWSGGLLAGLTLAMAMLPEEFPVVLTIFLALGAWRISRNRVLTRRVPAVETLGSATVLCVDKTGTLTANRMVVSRIYAKGKFCGVDENSIGGLDEDFHELVEFGVLASKRDPFDPMEKALNRLGAVGLANTEHLHATWKLIREYPLSPQLLALSHVWRSPDGENYVIAAKGAPEAIADLCHLTAEQGKLLAEKTAEMANSGLRVLGVARAEFTRLDLPEKQHDFHFELLGLIGLNDPVRPTVPAAIRECYRAGISVKMITGDYPGTARFIASQVGLAEPDKIITGSELTEMSDEQLRQRIGGTNVFARVLPEQKLRLVRALQANDEIVAMTGDGVNDAPALKAAHIGIAMGMRGTDVAREASSIVLLDDDFSSIVSAVRMGRRIFDNISKAMAYIFAIHVPIAGMSLIPVMLGWPLVLLPVHIVFLELIIDPSCSVVFEAEAAEPNVMRRRPRDPRQPLFSGWTILLSVLQGVSVLAVVLVIFAIAWYRGDGEGEARALTFSALIVANLGLILTNRSWRRTIPQMISVPNRALWWVVSGAVMFLGMVLYVPFLRQLFRLSFLHPLDLVICLVAGIVPVLWFEVLKVVRRRNALLRKRQRSRTMLGD